VLRFAESLDVAFAGKVVESAKGNISASQLTEQGMSVRLTATEQSVLTKIDALPTTALQGEAREYVANNYFLRNGYQPLEGKCGSGNCFDGVYLKDGKVYINEVKPLNADGTVKLAGPSVRADGSTLDTQLSDSWVQYSIDRLASSSSAETRRAAGIIQKALDEKTLVKLVSGVDAAGMTIVKIK
jgi:filamentous hemagglutinin